MHQVRESLHGLLRHGLQAARVPAKTVDDVRGRAGRAAGRGQPLKQSGDQSGQQSRRAAASGHVGSGLSGKRQRARSGNLIAAFGCTRSRPGSSPLPAGPLRVGTNSRPLGSPSHPPRLRPEAKPEWRALHVHQLDAGGTRAPWSSSNGSSANRASSNRPAGRPGRAGSLEYRPGERRSGKPRPGQQRRRHAGLEQLEPHSDRSELGARSASRSSAPRHA